MAVVRSGVLAALGALLWTLPFLVRLRRVPEVYWIARDDGIITLSHAKNLADHGTIGVSPGGDRVEGFSSPLHFAVGVVIETFADPSARTTTLVIFAVATAATGMLLTYGCAGFWRRRGARRAWVASLATVFVAGCLVSIPWTTTGWLASGMENPLVVLGGAMTLAGALRAARTRIDVTLMVVGAVCLMLSRVEFTALVVPLLVALVLVRDPGPGWPRRSSMLLLVGVPLVCAGCVHLARWWYFGAWLPNTAVVQTRDAGVSQVLMIGAIGLSAIAVMVRRSVIDAAPELRRPLLAQAWNVLIGLLVLAVFWLESTGRSERPISSVLIIPGVLEAGLVVAAALIVRATVSNRPIDPAHRVAFALALVPLTQYVVTGTARLDDNRVSGLAVPFLIVWAVIATIDAAVELRDSAALDRIARPAQRTAVIAACFAVLITATSIARADGARVLDFEIGSAPDTIAAVEAFAAVTFDEDALVITANPDLGKLSFAKRSVMVDLGWLGDPLFATLRATRSDLMNDYLRRIAVPDLVTTTGGWSCEYRGWLEHPDFVAAYVTDDVDGDWRRGPETCPADGRRTIWTRAVDDGEFELTDQILAADDPVTVVAAALDECLARSGDVLRCQHVRRAAQRSAEELRDSGRFDAVVATFETSPSARFDQLVLERGRGWWEPAADEAIRLLDQPA